MTESVDFNLIGLDELMGKLDSVTEDVRYRGGRSALRKAANLVANKAREKAQSFDDPETGRSIAKNIAVRWNGRMFRDTGNIAFRVGVMHGAKIRTPGNPDSGINGPTPHWRLIEFGTAKMAANPFMRTALSDNVAAATAEFITEYDKAIDRAIKRARKATGVT